MLKCLPTMRETQVWSLGWKDPLEKEMATRSNILAWRIPWTEERGTLQSMGSQTVGQHWATLLAFTFPILYLRKQWLHWLLGELVKLIKSWGRWAWCFSSVQSLSPVQLQPHGLQHARLPCPSPTPRAYSNSCPSSQWCHPTIWGMAKKEGSRDLKARTHTALLDILRERAPCPLIPQRREMYFC